MNFDNLSGQILGQYELREILGQGGMGAVYRGVQGSLTREVAIKILPMVLAQQQNYLERFNSEAKIAAALQHPHIVPIIDYGTQYGIRYVVMRLLNGGNLAQRLGQRAGSPDPLPSLGEAASMLNQLASALDYAHSQGVIHRDIKTSNIMFDNQGNTYLVDFGIAKLQDATHGLTGTGVTVGTSAYMPPEQWRSEQLTPAADQYAMGIVMYILVTGHMPYQADTPHGLMYKHFSEMPIPPQRFRADLPEDVSEVLNHALAKKPEDRFPSTMAFAHAFQRATSSHEGQPNDFFTFKIHDTSFPARFTPISPTPPSRITPVAASQTPPHIPTIMQPTPPPIPPLKPSIPQNNRSNRVFLGVGGSIVLIGAIALFLLNRQPSEALLPTTTSAITNTLAPTTAEIAINEPTATLPSQPPPTSLVALVLPTETVTPSLTPTLSPNRTPTSTPTTEPTVVALVAPSDTAIVEASPTVKLSATHTETPTQAPSDTPTVEPTNSPTALQPTITVNPPLITYTPTLRPTQPPATIAPTTTVNPTLITYTPSPRPTSTPSLTPTLTPTATATATHTDTPTATATSSATPTNTPTITPTPSQTLTPTVTYTPSLTPNAQQAAQTGTAQARITPTLTPTLYAPHDNDVITLSQPIMFYPSSDAKTFSLPGSGGVELPASTIVKVVSSQSTPIDGFIYSYVTLQSKVEGVSSDTGWTALASAAQATVTAHLQGGVIIRKGPGQGYERVGIGLKDGERAVILGQATFRKLLWYYVDPENPQSSPGWIYAGVKGLQIDGNTSNVPQRSYPPEPTATASPVPSETPTPAS